MVSGIESKGLSQAISALRAFQMDEKIVNKQQENIQQMQPQIEEPQMKKIPLREGFSQKRADEIKELAQNFDMQITNSDINYALAYGRSVIVDFSA